MKNILTITLIFIALLTGINSQAQCPRGLVNCHGECGRFIDEDGDGFCDIPQENTVSEDKTQDTQEPKPQLDTKNTKTKDEQKEEKNTLNLKEANAESEKNNTDLEEALLEAEEPQTIEAPIEELIIIDKENTNTKKTNTKKPYRLIGISILTLVVYLFTMTLVKLGKIRKFVHRRVWNVLLLITFLMSCLLGFVLVIQLNYGLFHSIYLTNLKLHVEFGIAMTIIAIIHILWHLPYFKKLFKKSRTHCSENSD